MWKSQENRDETLDPKPFGSPFSNGGGTLDLLCPACGSEQPSFKGVLECCADVD
ncbi:MAG TPA: hypothetical protein VIG80_04680 [Bacillaceae bacterium]